MIATPIDIMPKSTIVILKGTQYSQFNPSIHHPNPQDEVTLIHEQGNPHDSMAVKVYWNGISLGFIPRNSLDQLNCIAGFVDKAYLEQVNPTARYEKFLVKLEMRMELTDKHLCGPVINLPK